MRTCIGKERAETQAALPTFVREYRPPLWAVCLFSSAICSFPLRLIRLRWISFHVNSECCWNVKTLFIMLIIAATNAWTSEIRWREKRVTSVNKRIKHTHTTCNIKKKKKSFRLAQRLSWWIYGFLFSSEVLSLALTIPGLLGFSARVKDAGGNINWP